MSVTQQQLNRFFEILKASKLPSELVELINAPSTGHYVVIQAGDGDAQKISVSKLRGALGSYDVTTNTPTLTDGVGVEGDSYIATTAGTRDFGSGNVSISVDDILDYRNGKWLVNGLALTQGRVIAALGYTPLDKSTYTGTAQDLKNEIDAIAHTEVVDALNSIDIDKALSANQGRVLKVLIDDINTLLTSNDTTLDELQEVVDFIKANRDDLDNLTISNIAGLQTALDTKETPAGAQAKADQAETNAKAYADGLTYPNKANVRLDNIAADLSTAEQDAFKTKLAITSGGGSSTTLNKNTAEFIHQNKGYGDISIFDIHATGTDTALALPSYDGNTQGTHPSVLYFEDKFNGYHYWMLYTPYTNGNDQYENPSIIASNDKITWVVPNGLTNPIEPTPTETYYADTELVHGYDGKLYAYWRQHKADQSEFYIWCKTSVDGITWSAKTKVLTTVLGGGSPCIIKENGGYTLFDFDFLSATHTIQKRFSTNPLDFNGATVSNVTHDFNNGTREIWHFGLRKVDNTVYCVLTDTVNNTNGNSCDLYFGKLVNGNHFKFNSTPFLIRTTGGKWADSRLYRATFLPSKAHNNGVLWDIWYGGVADTTWKIGYTQFKTGLNPLEFPQITKTLSFPLEMKFANKMVYTTQTAAINVTIPNETTNPNFPLDVEVHIFNKGDGDVNIIGDTGVTIRKDENEQAVISGKYNAVTLKKIGANEWLLIGALKKVA
jgi:hypothetical protein